MTQGAYNLLPWLFKAKFLREESGAEYFGTCELIKDCNGQFHVELLLHIFLKSASSLFVVILSFP